MTGRFNKRPPRQHRFVQPSQDAPPRDEDPHRYFCEDWTDYKDKEPKLLEFWCAMNVYERVALILAVAGAVFISWLVARGVP
jgi:hypothetical protein